MSVTHAAAIDASPAGSGRRARMKLFVSAALIALAVAGCQQTTTSRNDPNRGRIPLAQSVLAELEQRGMTRQGNILIRIFKEEAELEVWKKDRSGRYAHFRTYPICKYSGDLGPKIREGDRQSPEGFYMVTPALMNPQSSFFLSFNLGFPNAFDRAHGRTGSHLMVHGDCSSRGCYAMTDEAIGEVYALAREALEGGQQAFQVQAFPFRMTPRNLARHRNSPHMAFWKNLKAGNDHFEVTRFEPQVDVCERRYVFNAVSPTSPLASLPGAGARVAAAPGGPVEMVSRPVDPWAGIGNARTATTTTAPATAVPTSINRPVTQVAPVNRAAPSRVTAVSAAEERPRFVATDRCPAYVVPPPIANAVAAKNTRDLREMAALSGAVAAMPARSGIDGGTHRTFADRHGGRQIRVGQTEPQLAFLQPQETPALVSAIDRAAPRGGDRRPAEIAAAATAPGAVPQVASAEAGTGQVAAAQANVAMTAPLPSPSPLRAAATSTPATAQQATPAAAPSQPAVTSVARQPAAEPAPVAPTAQAATPAPAAAPSGNWLTRMLGGANEPTPAAAAPAAEPAPAIAAPVPVPRPQAAAPVAAPRG